MNLITVSRYEFKYLLTAHEAPPIRRHLLRYCVPDTNALGTDWYGIQSLYLDTPDYAFYRTSVEKAVERLKLRVRGYTTGTGPLKVEVKRRVGDVVAKTSLLTTPPIWAELTGAGPRSATDAEVPLFLRRVEQMRATPKLLVRYERQALHSVVDDYVRVTFDRRIQCQQMLQWSMQGDPRGWLPVDRPPSVNEEESTYVLELKFKVAPPAWLHDMVTRFGLVRRGFSKYARATTLLRTERDPAWDLRSYGNVPGRAWRVA
jgi:hypothetical protein